MSILNKISELTEAWYDAISGDNGSRVCTGITEEACRQVPRNFFVQVLSMALTKTGDQLSSPRLVLTWLLSNVGASSFLISLLVPVRESLALLPQLLVAGCLRQHNIRKWFWVAGCLLQAVTIAAMAGVAFLWQGNAAGYGILALLVVFSLSRGICSVTGKDILGKTIPKTRRGLLSGTAGTVAGGSALAVGAFLMQLGPDGASLEVLTWILAGASVCWLVAAIWFSGLREYGGETDADGRAMEAAFKSLSLLKSHDSFRDFIIVRSCLIGGALVLPLIVLLAKQTEAGNSGTTFGLLVLGSGGAALGSSLIWGKIADWSSRKLLILVGVGSALACGATLPLYLLPETAGRRWWLVAVFLLMAVIHQGIRLARKTYLVDLATPENRAAMIALSNTVIGVMLLVIGGIVGGISHWGVLWAVSFCGLISLSGGLWAIRLKEV
jgi:hypothetical protein